MKYLVALLGCLLLGIGFGIAQPVLLLVAAGMIGLPVILDERGRSVLDDASDDRTDVLVRVAQTRYVESNDEDAVTRLEAELDAALGRPVTGESAALRSGAFAAYFTPEEIKTLAESRKGEYLNDAHLRRLNALHKGATTSEPVYTLGSNDPVDFIEVPRA